MMLSMSPVVKKILWGMGFLAFWLFAIVHYFNVITLLFEIISESRYASILFILAGTSLVFGTLGLIGGAWASRHLFTSRRALKTSVAVLSLLAILIAAGIGTKRLPPYFSLPRLLLEAAAGRTRWVERLVSHGVDPNIQDETGQTALMIASYAGYTEIAKVLLAYGADVNIGGEGTGITALMLAATADRTEIIRFLLDSGAEIDVRDGDCWTALKYAASYCEATHAVALLLDSGADPNASDYKGLTPMMGAAICGCTENVIVLLDDGADVNAKDNDGWTALTYATENGQTEVAEILRAAGAEE
jgi:ankyrin repeat protein